MLTNWMTTIPGVLLLARTLWEAWTTKNINWGDLQDALIAVGLIAAKDWNVTGGSRVQD
jgi:hypothetical protein